MFMKSSTKFDPKRDIFSVPIPISLFEMLYLNFSTKFKFEFISVYWGILSFF